MCICVQARDIGCPRSWSYRKFRATQKECWELNSMVITTQEQSTLLTSKPFLQPHLPFFFFETGLTIFKAGLLCSPWWLTCPCFLSAMIKGVPHHNGSNNWFLNDHPFSDSPQCNIYFPIILSFLWTSARFLVILRLKYLAHITLGTNAKRAILLELKAGASQTYMKGVGMHICTHADI